MFNNSFHFIFLRYKQKKKKVIFQSPLYKKKKKKRFRKLEIIPNIPKFKQEIMMKKKNDKNNKKNRIIIKEEIKKRNLAIKLRHEENPLNFKAKKCKRR